MTKPLPAAGFRPCHRALLGQWVEQLDRLDVATYRRVCPRLDCGSPGGHLRHCLEFYQCLLEGIGDARIDCDARRRDMRIERDPALARDVLEEIVERWDHAADEFGPASPLQVRKCGDTWLGSTFDRESRFLFSHAVHPMALIAALLRSRGIPLPDDFGVAPSTPSRRSRRLAARPLAA